MYKNELLSIQQKINLGKSQRKIFYRKSSGVLFTKQRSNKRKVKKWIQKVAKRRKRQDERVSKKKISATDSVQKRSITK